MSVPKPLLARIHHVGIAVADIDRSLDFYRQTLGLEAGLRRKLPERGVEMCFVELPDAKVELLAPLGESSPVGRFLRERGPGMHHLCYEVADIRVALQTLVSRGMQAIDAEPRPGAEDKLVAFLHPRSAGGVLIELQQR